jgi:drug/metabolite transporter (DMT)-like permease
MTKNLKTEINNYSLLIFLGAVWAASFVAIKFSNKIFNPIEVGFYRTAIGALFLFCAVKFRGGSIILFNENTRLYSLIGFLNASIPFTLLPYGLITLPSNIGVIILSANPFLALVLAHFFTLDEKLSIRKVIGSIIGFSGVVFAVGREVLVSDLNSLISALAIYIGASSYVISNLIIRRISYLPSDMVTMNTLFWGSIWLLPLVLIYGNLQNIEFSSIPVFAIIYLGVIPTGLAFSLRQVLIRNAGSTFMMQVGYIIPIFGVFYGWLFLGEEIGYYLIISVALVIAGIGISRIRVGAKTID